MNIAILGARATGKSWLAQELAQHWPHALITETPPLLAAAAHRSGLAPAAWQASSRLEAGSTSTCEPLTVMGIMSPLIASSPPSRPY